MNEFFTNIWRLILILLNVILFFILLPYYIVRKIIGMPVKEIYTFGIDFGNIKEVYKDGINVGKEK